MNFPLNAESLLNGLAWLLLAGYAATLLEFMLGNRSIPPLTGVDPIPDEEAPAVSIVIAARNEATQIEEALASVLRLDYSRYEIIVLNDRSEDATGEILERMREQAPDRLRVVHISSLPSGWLGKNHAMHRGAQAAGGDYLLFTDADVVLAPDALRRAMQLMRQRRLDHLAVLPQILPRGWALAMFMNTFTIFFSLFTRPWRARYAWSKAHIGIGAFNLISRDAYRRIGTHATIAMRPDDDIKLGKLVKKHGLRQDVAFGAPLVQVTWYASLPEMINGLMKNAFAGVDYNLPYTLFALAAQLVFSVWPVIALFVAEGTTWWLYAVVVALMLVLAADNARFHRLNPWSALTFPLGALLMNFIILRATYLTYRDNGIRWRGTHYTLAELRANRV